MAVARGIRLGNAELAALREDSRMDALEKSGAWAGFVRCRHFRKHFGTVWDTHSWMPPAPESPREPIRPFARVWGIARGSETAL